MTDRDVLWSFPTTGIKSSSAIAQDGTIYIESFDGNLYAINPNGCPSLVITPDKISAYIGDTITLTISSDPSTSIYTIEIKDQTNNIIGSCTTTDGTCAVSWSTVGLTAGSYNITARATDSGLEACTTSSTVVTLSGPISLMDSAWPKFHRDVRNSGYTDIVSYTDGSIKWEIQLIGIDSGQIGSPAIASDGTTYVTDYNGHYLFAINPNGTLKWTYDLTKEAWFGQLNSPDTGFHPTPAIDNNGTIYLSGSSDGVGSIAAIKPDGTLRWLMVEGGSPFLSSPSIGIDGSVIICGNYGETGKIYAIDPINLDISPDRSWISPLERWTTVVDSPIYTTPAISSDGRIWVSNASGLHVLDTTNGNVLNSIALSALYNSPIIGKDGTVYIVDSGSSSLLAINPTTYEIIWQNYYLENIGAGETISRSTPSIDDNGNIYVLSDTVLYSISTTDHTTNWSYSIGDTDGASILSVDKNTIYTYGTINGNYCSFAINKDGTLKWNSNIDTYKSTPSINYNGVVYAGTYYGSLIALDSKTPANIVATTITSSETICTEPCDITVDITWTNTGETTGSFIPSIKIDNVPIKPEQYPLEELAPGNNTTHTFTIIGLVRGDHVICVQQQQ